MPKKTKKEKILAQHRRIHIPLSISDNAKTVATGQTLSAPYQFRSNNQQKNEAKRMENSIELVAIKGDLVKTLTLATIAIAVEIILYAFIHTK